MTGLWLVAGCVHPLALPAAMSGAPETLQADDDVVVAFLGTGARPQPGPLNVWFRSGPMRDRGRHWDELLDGVAGMVLPVPHRARGDEDLRRWRDVWAGGGAPWRTLDVVSDGVRWRILVVDVLDGGREGSDQAFWLPDVVSHDDHDHLVVVSNLPLTGPAAGPRGRDLYEGLLARTEADRILLVASGVPGASGARLTAGPWGELTLEVGRADGALSAVPLRQDPPLLDGFVRAAAAAAGVEEPSDVLPGSAFAGHWEVVLRGEALDAHWCGPVPYHLRWGRSRGWVVVP